jgi:hypothetical protein
LGCFAGEHADMPKNKALLAAELGRLTSRRRAWPEQVEPPARAAKAAIS